jgi:hypothetical protein
MIHNKAGQFLGGENASFASADQSGSSGDPYSHSLSSGPSSSVKQGLMPMREGSGRMRAGREADAKKSGTDALANIRDRSRASAAAKYAPSAPVQRERFGGAKARGLRAPSASREGEDTPGGALHRAGDTDAPTGSTYSGGAAFGDGGGHVTAGASAGGWGSSGGGAGGRRGQKGWGTSGGVIAGRYTGVHEANFEDRTQQNMSASLKHAQHVSFEADEDAGAFDADDDMKPRGIDSRLGRSGSLANRERSREGSAHDAVLNPEDEEEKARLGLPTSYSKLSQKNPWLLNPRSPRMMYWDALVGAFLLFTATFTPYEVAFMDDVDGDG